MTNIPSNNDSSRLNRVEATEKLKTLEQAIALIEQHNLDWSVGRYPVKDKYHYWGVIRSGHRRADSRGEHNSPLSALLDAYARYETPQYPVTQKLSAQKLSQL